MKRSFFLDYFPPPKYLAMPALGFDVSDRSVKYVELQRKRGAYTVSKYGTKVIPQGIIESGEIKQKEKLIDFLSSLKKELGAEHVVVALPEEKAFLSRVKLPEMNGREIRSAIELQLEEHIPLSANDAIFDFELARPAGNSANESGKYIDVNLVAFSKDLVEDYRDVFVGGGFFPLAFEMETRASARAVVPENDKRTYFIVDFGKTRTTFTIVSAGKVQFTSTISVAGDDLSAALAKNLNIDIQQAEKIKIEKGLVKGKGNEEVFNSILPVVSVIKDELSRHMSYWDSQLNERGESAPPAEIKGKKIAKILLCGGDSNLSGFSEYLSYELKTPVELSNPWINITSFSEHIPEIELRESLIYTTALGLALRSVAQ
ncbi:MAG: type IV pilus assembly protein PilM [bacterium]|nr:type IV pilus assembly protein PilM [bacterium]